MFLPIPTLFPLSVPTQANPMAFQQGIAWIMLVFVLAVGGALLWLTLTRESELSEATAPEESEASPPSEEAAPAVVEAEASAEAETPEAQPAPVAVLASTTKTTKATTKKRPGRPAKKKKPQPKTGDDFTRIEGVGPKINTVLKEAGITSYAQLAESNVEALYTVVREAKIRAATPDTWPEQAALAAAGQWTELESLQDNLKGGRRVD